jgi:putative ABC transport system substrate-binding protein
VRGTATKRSWIFDFGFSISGAKSRKVICFALSALLFALCFPVWAQQPGKIPRIAYVSGSGVLYGLKEFRQALRDLGYIEGKSVLVEYRSLEGRRDRAPGVIAELVRVNTDVLVLPTTGGIQAAKQATKTIPIVMVATFDPVAAGIVESLARPGGNITGVTRLAHDLSGKRLELLKEVLPRLSRVGILWVPGDSDPAFKRYEAAARELKIELQSLGMRDPNLDLDAAFQPAAKGLTNALIVTRNSLINRYQKRIADLAIKIRLPSMYESNSYVEAGGLISYSADETESYRRAALYVDKILKGAKPADLPVEQPTKFELVINLKTAKQIGLTIPPNVLARADRVIR